MADDQSYDLTGMFERCHDESQLAEVISYDAGVQIESLSLSERYDLLP